MLIRIENTLLASPDLALGRVGPFGLSLNGQQIVEEVDFFRAAELVFFARGGLGVTLQFSVIRLFPTVRRADAFYLTHAGTVPLEGVISCICGEGADLETVYLDGAVVSAIAQPPRKGTAVEIQYSIRGGRFTSDVPEDLPGSSDSAEETIVMRRGKVAIASGATSVAVVFSASLAAVPVVTPGISRPTGGDAIWPILREDTITVDGFTCDLSGPPPDANYKLHYIAVE